MHIFQLGFLRMHSIREASRQKAAAAAARKRRAAEGARLESKRSRTGTKAPRKRGGAAEGRAADEDTECGQGENLSDGGSTVLLQRKERKEVPPPPVAVQLNKSAWEFECLRRPGIGCSPTDWDDYCITFIVSVPLLHEISELDSPELRLSLPNPPLRHLLLAWRESPVL